MPGPFHPPFVMALLTLAACVLALRLSGWSRRPAPAPAARADEDPHWLARLAAARAEAEWRRR
jgi:hypothetical protein